MKGGTENLELLDHPDFAPQSLSRHQDPPSSLASGLLFDPRYVGLETRIQEPDPRDTDKPRRRFVGYSKDEADHVLGGGPIESNRLKEITTLDEPEI